MMIKLNGDTFEVDSGATLLDLAKMLDLEGKRYAIEVNEDIISRSEHANYGLSVNDRVEVVQAIGGG